MATEASIQSNYRYPGSRPFYDNDIDRRLFFGRDTEKETLLHKVLADNLVVLYARSGLGKTSLLNAGLNQALRERGFIPLTIRLNEPGQEPVQWIYARIREICERKHLAFDPGEEDTLWQYFKTAYFWSGSNKMLKPVLILDQFEDFFALYSPESRKRFIRQMADVVNNKVPASLLESLDPKEPFPYSDKPTNVKVIISIREDYLGQLDEMSREIPGILHHRFRLLPLSREQARDAIIKPAHVQDEAIRAVSFTFAQEAVDMMLDFLCKRKERGITKKTDEVESFQLQLLCQDIENRVEERVKKGDSDIIIKKKDLGGEKGMERVLQQFYDDQLEMLVSKVKKKRVRKLCEEGLISITDRRLSLEEEEITRKYKVSEILLQKLVNCRLLRAEPRVGSVYYELSHDTLVAPIRESQKERIAKKNKVNKLYEEADKLRTNRDYKEAQKKYEAIIEIDKTYFKAYLELGQIFYKDYNYDKAIEIYKLAIKNKAKNALIYYHLGNALFAADEIEEAIQNFEKSIKLDPNLSMTRESLGEVYASKKNFKKAIELYRYALNIDKKQPRIYRELAVSYIKDSKPDRAIEVFQEAINVDTGYADIYRNIAEAFKEEGEGKYIDRIYEIAFQSGSQKAYHYLNLGFDYGELKKYDKAIDAFQKAIDLDPEYAAAYYNKGTVLRKQGKYNEAITASQKAIELDPKYAAAYNNMGIALRNQEKYEEAIEAYTEAIKLNPKYASPYHNMGYVLDELRRYDEAIEKYEEAIKLDPKDAAAYYNKGIVLRKQGKYNEAIDAFQKAIELDPKDASAYYYMGDAYYRLKKYNEAIEAFQKAVELDSKYVYAYNNMGIALRKQGKYNEAIEAYKKAIEIDPKDAAAYNNMGVALNEQKRYKEAIANYEKAIELDPADTSAKTNIAEVYLNSEQFNDALKWARDLLKQKDIPTQYILAMRFVSISSLVFQGKSAEAVDELKEFIKFYRSIPGEYERTWSYTFTKEFITSNKKLTPEQRKLLLQLVDLLESPKEKGDKKLKELENAVREIFK